MPELIQGTHDPRFAGVHAAFLENFTGGMEVGAAVSVVLNGRTVVDLWGGHKDAGKRTPWAGDTLVNVWSVTKGIVALAVAQAVQAGRLDYTRPVADYWPEFGANGKAGITLNQLLSHQAGLDGLDVPMDMAGLIAWDPYVSAFARMAPLWEPGSRFLYHFTSFGHLAAEVLRRVDGRRIGDIVAQDIAAVLGAEFYIGLPAVHDLRAADLITTPDIDKGVNLWRAGPYPQSVTNPHMYAGLANDRGWRAAELPGLNGQSHARALAAIYGDLVCDAPRLMTNDTLNNAITPRFTGVDAREGNPVNIGAGLSIHGQEYSPQASPRSFGHGGWGGGMDFGDPDHKIGFGYVTNYMLAFDDGIDPRRTRLIRAVYDAMAG